MKGSASLLPEGSPWRNTLLFSRRKWGLYDPVRSHAFSVLLFCIVSISSLQAAPRPSSWRKTTTDHFSIIYQAKDAEVAAEVARFAPSVWQRVTTFLDYEPKERVPVVIRGNTARANGLFTPFPAHVELFVASPAGPIISTRSSSWIETVFVHEFTHYVHLTRPIGFFGSLSRVLGPLTTSASSLFLPGWAIEGITTNAETILTDGGRGRNPFFEMTFVAPILENTFYTYDQAGFSSTLPPRGRIYSAGYLTVSQLLDRYGSTAFIELNRRFQRAPFLGMRRALERTTGLSAEDLHAQQIQDLSIRYEARRAMPSGEALSPPERLTITFWRSPRNTSTHSAREVLTPDTS